MNRMLPQLLWIAGWLLVPFVQFGQAPSLGVTSDFSIFTAVGTLSNVPVCNVIGDIGTNFGTNAWTENVNGTSHPSPNATTALCALDLNSLYGQLNGAADVTVAAVMGSGQTLVAGVTRVASNATLSGTLFLDAQGDNDAVFIIRVEGTLDVSALSEVRLVNGASPCNVFWRVEDDLTMMTNVRFVGTVAGNGDIVTGAGTYVSGRLLTQNGNVTATQSRIFIPPGCNGGPIIGPTPPDLGDVECFVFFSSDGQLSNAGGSVDLDGNVGSNGGGTNPSTAGFTGFNGTVEFMNALTLSGANDLTGIYNSLQIGSLASEIELLFPADCGNGLRLTPHVYLVDANTTITDTLIFDAQGTDRSIFVVQVNGTLDVSANAVIHLLNGARSSNIFWIVEGDVNIAANASFKGTIIADAASAVVATGTAIEGRILTEQGDVTWSGTTGTLPTDGSGPCGTPVINVSPIAEDDFEEMCENADTAAFNVQFNDVDPDFGTLTTTIVSGPDNGFAEVGDDMIHYIPDAGFSGNDTIIYAVCDDGSPSLCDTAMLVINVNDQPTVDAGIDQTICAGDTVQIGTPAVAGHTYSWTPSIGLDDDNNAEPMAFPADTTTYVLTITRTATGCTNVDSVTIDVKPFPITDAGADSSICLGDSLQIGSPTQANYTYSWSPSTDLSEDSVADPFASPTASEDYVVTVTNTISGCVQTDTISITVDMPPVADAGTDQTICSADSVQIGSAAISGNTYSWSPSADLDDASAAMPWASPSDSTQYVVLVTTTLTGCMATDTVLVHVNPSPDADAGSDITICEGDSIQIGGAGAAVGVTYSWSPGTAMDSTGLSNPTVAPIVTTVYVVVATDTTSGCESTDTVVVTVNPVAMADAGPDQDLCSADSVQIGTPGVPGNTYSWSPSTGLSSSTDPMPWVTVDDTTTYVLTVSSTTSSCQRTDTVTVNVGTTPTADAGPDQSACDGDAVQIGTPGVAGVTYSWSPSAGLDDDSAAQPMADPILTTQYILTATDIASGCEQTDTVVVSVGSTPGANAGVDRTICEGESTLLGTLGLPLNNYSWSPGDDLNDSTIAQPTASPSDSTEYVLTAIQNSSGCQNTDTVMVFVNPLPDADAGTDVTICEGDSVQIGAAATVGLTYSWSPGTAMDSTGLSNPTVAPSDTTTYVVTVTNTASGCESTDTIVVTVNPVAMADAGPDQDLCSADSVQIGTPGVPGNTYSWAPSAGLSSASDPMPWVTADDTTTYILTVSSTTSSCQRTDTVTVNVGTTPTADAGPDQSACDGDAVQLGTPGVAGVSYSWSPSAGLDDDAVAQPMADPIITTQYVLTATDIASGCQQTDTVIVSVGTTPTANAGPDRAICEGQSTLLGTLGLPTNNYGWSPGDDLNDSTIAQPTASPSDSTEYVLTVIQNSSGCQNTDTVLVFVNPIPVADAGTDQSMCLGETVVIGSASQPGFDYSWSPVLGLDDPDSSMTDASPLLTTQYVLTVTDDDTGCSQTDTVLVTVTTAFPPVADAGPDRSICAGDSVQIGTDGQGGLTYSWSPSAGLDDATLAEPTASPADSTEYILTVVEGTTGCDATDTVMVHVSPVPVANAGADQYSCGGETVQLGGSVTAGYSYSWSPSAGLSDSTSASVTAGPAVTTTYTYTVTDTASGCSATDVVIVSTQDGSFYSGFSPNGDSYNDTWTIPMLNCYPTNSVEIVNRWGSRVWISDDYDNEEVVWDGKNMNNEEVPDGTYYYTIRYNDTEQRGWVFVKR